MIMHIDMDAFFASVEQRVNPALRGKPVIIGGRNNPRRSIICAASYEAKAAGVKNAMPSWEALAICPQAIFVPADSAKYLSTSHAIFAMLQGLDPEVERASIDEFFLYPQGAGSSAESSRSLGRSIKGRIRHEFGLTCTVGIAPTRVMAKLAAKLDKPDGLKVLTREAALAVLKDLSVDRLCGIGRRLKRRLNYLGVETCGQLAAFPDDILREQFGVVGLRLKAAVRVEDVGDLDAAPAHEAAPKSVGHSYSLPEPVHDREILHNWIYLLSEMVAVRLRRLHLAGQRQHFYFQDGWRKGYARQRMFAQPTHDGYEIYQRSCRIVDSLVGPGPGSFRALGISVGRLSPSDPVYVFPCQNRREELLQALDHINARFGDWSVFPAALRDVCIPLHS